MVHGRAGFFAGPRSNNVWVSDFVLARSAMADPLGTSLPSSDELYGPEADSAIHPSRRRPAEARSKDRLCANAGSRQCTSTQSSVISVVFVNPAEKQGSPLSLCPPLTKGCYHLGPLTAYPRLALS